MNSESVLIPLKFSLNVGEIRFQTMTSASSITTRADTEVWLIGQPVEAIEGRKLPSNGDVLRRLFWLIRSEGSTLKEATSIIVQEVVKFWKMARIPTKADYHVIPKVEKLYDNWRALQKHSSRRSVPQVEKEHSFVAELDNLFDIAHANALNLPTLPEDQQFLLAQREKGRRGYMGGVDKEFVAKETRKMQRRQDQERLRYDERRKEDELTAVVEFESSSSSDEEQQQPTTNTVRKRKRGTTNIITQDIASALDRSQVSDRNAVYILSATASSLGQDVKELAINRSTIRRTRINTRENIAALIRESFAPQIPLTVHWDGKILPVLTGTDKVDRLPVLVSGGGVSKLLGVPILPSGTGQAMAKAVVDCLDDWNIKHRVVALSFDTTSSNTGCKAGACTIIETMLGRLLLHLACRHHIMEIIADKVFAACHIQSTGPDILLFKRFQQQWEFIDKERYDVLEDHVINRDDILTFCRQQLGIHQPRDDYRELLELCMIFLGDTPPRGIRFMQPGALHRARWMARVIYAIKLCLFRSQFVMSKQEQSGMNRFGAFAVRLYVRSWFEAPQGAAAPANDLELLKRLASYDDKDISRAAVSALSRHLWYLSEPLVSLSFFDSNTSLSVKREMVKALYKEGSDNPAKRINIDATSSSFQGKTVADFVSQKSRDLFEALKLRSEFLTVDPSEWDNRADYREALNVVESLKVVNDSAERAVALMQKFNSILTKNEDQKQYILQVVERHQDKFPNSLKKTLTGIKD